MLMLNWSKRSETANVAGDKRETSYLFQQLSAALQRGNSSHSKTCSLSAKINSRLMLSVYVTCRTQSFIMLLRYAQTYLYW